MTCVLLQFPKNSILINIWMKGKMRSTKCSPTTSSCFQRHQWAKSEGLFPSPLVPVLGAACEVMWWTGMWWSVVPPYIRVFFHEWDYKKTTENGASQFPSHSKELKATTGIRCLCVCVSLCVWVSGSFPGLLRVNREGCEWSVFQNWAMRSCWHIHLKRNSLFSKAGVG